MGGLMAAQAAAESGASVLVLGGSGGASARISSLVTALGDGPGDTADALFDDMFAAGGHLNNPAFLRHLVDRIGPQVRALAAAGVPFHVDDGRLARRQTTGCSWPSSVYSLEMIGVDISQHLLAWFADHGVRVVRGGRLVDLTVHDGVIAGGLAHDPYADSWLDIVAPSVVLATGGAGQLFTVTTNPRGSRGDGYAMALEAGAQLVDMEFISYEPFITTSPDDTTRHDLPTTLLTEGARLLNGQYDEFLDTRASLTKDVICRAMVAEVQQGRGTANESVYYDIRDIDEAGRAKYVQLAQALGGSVSAAATGLIEVMPAQHYLDGGIRVADDASAVGVTGLFAVGEVAGGAHGAHRLAGAGGMEVVAGGSIAGHSAADHAIGRSRAVAPVREPLPSLVPRARSARAISLAEPIAGALDACGVFRHGAALSVAEERLDQVLSEASADDEFRAVRRAASVAVAIAGSAARRTESRGDHYRSDHPERRDEWTLNQRVSWSIDDGVSFELGSAAAELAKKGN